MKTPTILSLLALSVALLAVPGPFNRLSAAEEEEEEQTELGNHMEEIGGAWRKVRRGSIDPANNGANAERVAGMIKHAKASLDLIPQRAEDVPEIDREAFIGSFKKEAKQLVELLTKLEKAFADDDNEAAAALIAQIGKHQKASHKEFKRPDDDA